MAKTFAFLLLVCAQSLYAAEGETSGRLPKVHALTAKKIDIGSIDITTLDQDLISHANVYFSGQNMMSIKHEDLTEIKMDNNGMCHLVGLVHALLSDINFMDKKEGLTPLLSHGYGPKNFAYLKPLIAKVKKSAAE